MPDEKDSKKGRVKVEVIEEEPKEVKEDKTEEVLTQEENSFEIPQEEEVKTPVSEEHTTLPLEMEAKPKKEGLPWGIMVVAFLIGLTLGAGLIGGIFYYKSNALDKLTDEESVNTNEEFKMDEDQVVETPAPDSMVEEKTDLTKLKVQILNGSGIKGEASKVEDLLADLEFESIETGNAQSYDFEDTEVALKENLKDNVFDGIEEKLSAYSVKKADDLKDDFDYDVVITVGSTKN